MASEYPFPIQYFLKRKTNPKEGEGYVLNKETGEMHEALVLLKPTDIALDTQQFIKTYMDFFTVLKDLTSPAVKVLCYIGETIKRNHTEIKLRYEDVAPYCGYKTKRPFYVGVKELLEKKIIEKKSKGVYYVNANYLFKGDRRTIKQKRNNEGT